MIDGIPVVDAIVHPYNLSAENAKTPHAPYITRMLSGANHASLGPGYRMPREIYERNWPMEDVALMTFVESYADLAAYHVLPIGAFHDGICGIDKALEAKRRWPQRFVFYAGVDPMQGQKAIDELEEQHELLEGPSGLKMYPNSWVGDQMVGWKMDDPEIAFPLFQKALDLGIKVVAIHKALPLGPVELEYYAMDDIDRAAMAFPDLQFEVVHGGMGFLDETAWQVARFDNVWINLESTATMLTTKPRAFEQALATFAGRTPKAFDRMLWGTGCMVTHPRPHLEKFARNFQFSEELQQEWGVPELTDTARRKILAENYASMHGFSLQQRLDGIGEDEFTRRQAELGAVPDPYSTTTLAGLVY
ncbi:amidohydrolase family protein [Rhodococcus globerulus]|uniref:Amidohydrolase family protein n=1 Tax=Rhodococcus globerulus TaxID=33008 RepID=A0ABU4C3E5_RHOGO|nr:amidohydrolase family protein [Rhodococcus globerulus]MDV6271019.1 amidohydrolase family protein [Rhodococcus globerulus]